MRFLVFVCLWLCVACKASVPSGTLVKLRGTDSNRRPSGYEPDEIPDFSTPRHPCKVDVW